ncbi:MAG: heme NO-binding domain-containing protein [Magnetococcales bacterium]|nr:heme NO-binding domain-containing protein [Magnetococcales bacterium]
MHGIIFLAFEDFLGSRLGSDAWPRILERAGLDNSEFSPDQFYPDQNIFSLFSEGARLLGIAREDMLRQFGTHLAPGLVEMGRSTGIIHEHWKTMDILEHLNSDILSSFPNPRDNSLPPDIRTYRLKHGEVAIAYVSKRKLCPLLKGILMGMGEVFNEPIAFKEPVCMLNGAPLCRLSVYLDDPLLQRYVNINREFEIIHSRIEEIRLFSQFKGIPFSGSGLVLRYNHEEVLIQTQGQILAAMREHGLVFMAVSHLPVGLKASVKNVDLQQGTALLTSFSLTDGTVGQRCFKRVAPETPVPVHLFLEEKKYSGSIDNLSGGGIAVALKRGQTIDEMMLFVPVRVEFKVPLKWLKVGDTIELGPHEVALDGNILDVLPLSNGQRIRIIFSPLNAYNLHIMDQYFQFRQGEVQVELQALMNR